MKILPDSFSSYAADIDGLIIEITIFVVAWFVVSTAALFYGIFTSLKTEGGKAKYIPGIGWEQTKWILIPLILVVACDMYIDIITTKVWTKVEFMTDDQKAKSVPVKVTGQQFEWSFQYAGADGKLGTTDDFDGDYGKPLILPVNKVSELNLSSVDMLHNFFVREFRFKQDVIPGRVIVRWVEATQISGKNYELICAEICGSNHGSMRGEVKVVSPEDYAEFLANPAAFYEGIADIKPPQYTSRFPDEEGS
ncbi:MAG: hypothetical protein ABUK01_08485 [Leptospirales bacterium]